MDKCAAGEQNHICFPAVVPAVAHGQWPPPVQLLLPPVENQVIFTLILWYNPSGAEGSFTMNLEPNTVATS